MLVMPFIMPLLAWKLDLTMLWPRSVDFCLCSQRSQVQFSGTASHRLYRVLKAAISNECNEAEAVVQPQAHDAHVALCIALRAEELLHVDCKHSCSV